MKFTCDQAAFARALGAAGRAIATRTTMPILGHVLALADQGRLQLTATTLELTVTYAIEAEVEERGETALPFRLTSEFVHALSGGAPVQVGVDKKDVAHYRCGRTASSIKGLPGREFPAVPTLDGTSVATIKASLLAEVILQVVPAVATDMARPIFTAVLTRLGADGALRMVGADGFRLAVRDATIDTPPKEEQTLLIPGRTLVEVSRILASNGKGEESPVEVGLSANKNHIVFRRANAEVAGRLVEGQFPNYQAVLPKDSQSRVELASDDLLAALRSARVFTEGVVRIEFSDGKLVLHATSPDRGENTSELEAGLDGDAGRIAFNVRYLADAIDCMGNRRVRLEVRSPNEPGVIRPIDGPELLHVLMPMADPQAA